MRCKYSLICAHCGRSFHPYGRRERYCGRSCASLASHLVRDRDIATRLWTNLDRGTSPDSCWRWCGYHDKGGYGKIQLDGKPYRVHRLSWELTYGAIPSGIFVCHHCDVRDCVRPAHLFLGSQADNIADRDRKQRQPHGERQGSAKLTVEDVRVLRQEREAGVTLRVLAQRFGVSTSLVSVIARRTIWKHID